MKLGVFCSGGDAPGMNACVRSVVRAALSQNHQVVGINRGYQGLLNADFYADPTGQTSMQMRTVSDWSKYGGAFLRSSRSEEFRTSEGQQKAAAILRQHQFDAIIPIGGNGTFAGAIKLAEYWDGQIVGCPGTIDNDLIGTDYTIGFSTAVQTAVEAVDKIRDTAESHELMFLIEVMGRHSGYIALYTALACGAEVVAIPETTTKVREICEYLHVLKKRGKTSVMMIVAEGDEVGGAEILAEQLKQTDCPFASRVVVLGHLQRGGAPTPEDRWRATMMGSSAIAAVLRGETGVMCGTRQSQPVTIPLKDAIAGRRPIPQFLLDLMAQMAS